MCGLVLLRWIHDLSWLNATANAFMILAIATATIAGLIQFVQNQQQQQNDNNDNWQDQPTQYDVQEDNDSTQSSSSSSSSRSLVSRISTFAADMFFAFEGIGLVLPVENSFSAGRSPTGTLTTRTTTSPTTTTDPMTRTTSSLPTTTTTTRRQKQEQSPSSLVPTTSSSSSSFSTLLIQSMTTVAALFAVIGISASLGYPHIQSGSVTAFLKHEHADNPWLQSSMSWFSSQSHSPFPCNLPPPCTLWKNGGWRRLNNRRAIARAVVHRVRVLHHPGLGIVVKAVVRVVLEEEKMDCSW